MTGPGFTQIFFCLPW